MKDVATKHRKEEFAGHMEQKLIGRLAAMKDVPIMMLRGEFVSGMVLRGKLT